MQKYIVIMAGGVGSRFWPRSRKRMPKQLLNIFGKNSMIRDTVERVLPVADYENILIVTNKVQKALIEEQIPELPAENIIAEPRGRNTAPCINLAAEIISKRSGDSVMITLPADHLINDEKKFLEDLEKATDFAENNDALLTFGIKPEYPNTGYGYIKILSGSENDGVWQVDRFVEKPDIETAKGYLKSGDYLWNSGMFVWRVSVILDEIKKHLPELYNDMNIICEDDRFYTTLSDIFERITPVSIDYGIMEKSDKVWLVPGDFGWSDVGSWETAYQLSSKDINGNAIHGNTLTIDTKNSYVHSDKVFTAVIGMNETIVINTGDAVLVCPRDKSQKVKEIVEYLEKNNINGLI